MALEMVADGGVDFFTVHEHTINEINNAKILRKLDGFRLDLRISNYF
jgi:hypothetical protein